MKPQRIQLRRAKGWRMPPNTVKVDRTTQWGNPFVVGAHGKAAECVHRYLMLAGGMICVSTGNTHDQKAAFGVMKRAGAELKGKNLACWCRLCERHKDGKPIGVECPDCAPCHAEVLLELANREEA